jgi:membrane-bound lytic murein transglycosylase C
MVERYADKFGLDVPLVLAIIQTESGFNPNLISSRNAHGLMQVVPATAGGEVHRWLGRDGQPSSTELLSPDVNIRYGMTYIHLLRSKHLEGVHDPQSLEYCVIASYNGGSGAVLRLFGSKREDAVAAINKLSPQEVLAMLTEKFPAQETRHFVRKVLQFRRQYVLLAAHKPAPVPAPALPMQTAPLHPTGAPTASAPSA